MIYEKIRLAHKQADGYIIPLGKFNMVFAFTQDGMVGCGMFDVMALDKFDYPAVRVRPGKGDSITNIDDLLTGIVKDINQAAEKRGVNTGMSGKEALNKF